MMKLGMLHVMRLCHQEDLFGLPVILVIFLSLLGCAKTPSDNVTATAPNETSSGGLPTEEVTPPVAPVTEDQPSPGPDESSSDHAMTLSENGNFLEKLETVDRCHDIPTGYLYAAQFDELGNLKCRAYDGKFYSYTYDILGHLTKVTDEGPHASPLDPASLTSTNNIRQTVMEMAYDHQGQLRRKTASNITTYYIGGSYEIREEGGSQSKTLSITAPGLGLISTVTTGKLPSQPGPEDIQRLKDKPMEGTSAAGPAVDTLYYWPNHLGTPSTLVTHLVNGQPEVVSRDLKLPYGMDNRANSRGVVSTPSQYTGYTYLEENKLYYANARYYDPVIGRFASADNRIINASAVDGYNLFVYAANDPITFRDNGNSPEPSLFGMTAEQTRAFLGGANAIDQAGTGVMYGSAAAAGGAVLGMGAVLGALQGAGDAALYAMGVDAAAVSAGIGAIGSAIGYMAGFAGAVWGAGSGSASPQYAMSGKGKALWPTSFRGVEWDYAKMDSRYSGRYREAAKAFEINIPAVLEVNKKYRGSDRLPLADITKTLNHEWGHHVFAETSHLMGLDGIRNSLYKYFGSYRVLEETAVETYATGDVLTAFTKALRYFGGFVDGTMTMETPIIAGAAAAGATAAGGVAIGRLADE